MQMPAAPGANRYRGADIRSRRVARLNDAGADLSARCEDGLFAVLNAWMQRVLWLAYAP
jgi:hypothetical protein